MCEQFEYRPAILRMRVKGPQDIPQELDSKKGWRRKGYKPVETRAKYIVSWWNGMYWCNYMLYHKDYVIPIRGKKAEKRRLSACL